MDIKEKFEEETRALEPAIVKNRDDRIMYPKEHVLRLAMEQKLFIVDDTLLDKPDVDWSHFDFMLGNISPTAWKGVTTYLQALKLFWTELSPYTKKLVVNYEVANSAIKGVELDIKDLLSSNAEMITYLKYEDQWNGFKEWKRLEEEKNNSPLGKDI